MFFFIDVNNAHESRTQAWKKIRSCTFISHHENLRFTGVFVPIVNQFRCVCVCVCSEKSKNNNFCFVMRKCFYPPHNRMCKQKSDRRKNQHFVEKISKWNNELLVVWRKFRLDFFSASQSSEGIFEIDRSKQSNDECNKCRVFPRFLCISHKKMKRLEKRVFMFIHILWIVNTSVRNTVRLESPCGCIATDHLLHLALHMICVWHLDQSTSKSIHHWQLLFYHRIIRADKRLRSMQQHNVYVRFFFSRVGRFTLPFHIQPFVCNVFLFWLVFRLFVFHISALLTFWSNRGWKCHICNNLFGSAFGIYVYVIVDGLCVCVCVEPKNVSIHDGKRIKTSNT